MDVNRNTQIVINDDLLRKIVYCIEKAIGDDLRQYLRENHREASLMQYIKPDFARLTDIGPSEDTDEDAKPDKKGLVAIKSGIKPKLREIEKKA